MNNAFNYVITKGIETEALYPYKGYNVNNNTSFLVLISYFKKKLNFKSLNCESDIHKIVANVSVKRFQQVASQDEIALQQAVTNVGPISVGKMAEINAL